MYGEIGPALRLLTLILQDRDLGLRDVAVHEGLIENPIQRAVIGAVCAGFRCPGRLLRTPLRERLDHLIGNRVHVTVAEEWDQIKETLDSIEEMVAGEGFEPPTYGL
jgi:hypothetical protein